MRLQGAAVGRVNRWVRLPSVGFPPATIIDPFGANAVRGDGHGTLSLWTSRALKRITVAPYDDAFVNRHARKTAGY
jgi:hypothetical protein